MGILQRIYARAATTVWETETSLLHACALTRAPVAVQWIATSACDLHCPHCYSSAGRRAPDELDTHEARTLIIDELARLGAPTLVFAGGEMSLRRDMPELIEYAVARGLRYAIHTHGGHVERLREVFAAHPPDLAAISLDGDRTQHDGFRGRVGSFAAALRAIAVLAECGCPEIVVGTTITRENADHLEALYPIVVNSGAHTWGLHLFAPEGRGAEHQALLPTPAQLRRVVEFARRRRAAFHVELCNEWGSAGDQDLYVRDQPFSCGAGRISFVIASNGDVMPCTTTDTSEREGNVREQPLHELWAQGFSRFRRPGTDATLDARECWLQTRNGVEVRRHAFGSTPLAPPLERLTRMLVARVRPEQDGRGAVASGRATNAVRWAAVGLAFLDGCVREVRAPHPTPEAPSPSHAPTASPATDREAIDAGLPVEFPEALAQAISTHFSFQSGRSWPVIRLLLLESEAGRAPWSDVDKSAGGLTAAGPQSALREVIVAHARARGGAQPEALGDLVGLLNALESVPSYDGAFAAYLWRRARAMAVTDQRFARERVLLFARLHLHLRVVDALARGQAATAPVEFSAWRSKASPPVGWMPTATVPDGMVPAARAAFDATRGLPWDRVAVALEVVGEATTRAALIRDARSTVLANGSHLQLGRLDVVRADTEVRLQGAGGLEVRLTAGTELTLDRLGEHLDAATTRELAALVDSAARGDATADARAEAMLPWLQGFIRAWLLEHPEHAGAGKLRMWLVTFDE